MITKTHRNSWQETLAGILMLFFIGVGFYYSVFAGLAVCGAIVTTICWLVWLAHQEGQ